MTIRFRTGLFLGSLIMAVLAFTSGPPSFDSVDGSEFAVSGSRLEIAHAPGYPLFLFLLRITSLAGGPLYGHMRIITCLLAGACLPAVYCALRSHGASKTAAAASAATLLLLAPLLSQMNVLEVHGTAILLLMLAVSLRNSRAGPFMASLALFGGHPAGVLLLPLAFSRRWFSKWATLAVLPASLLLYVPLRAGACTVAHYTRPSTLPHVASYFTMYSDVPKAPSTEGLERLAAVMGPVCAGAVLLLSVAGGRPAPGASLSIILGAVFLSVYRVPDYESFGWLLLVPLAFPMSGGIDRFLRGGTRGRVVLACLLLPCMFHGVRGAWRGTDDAAPRYSRDILAGLPAGAVLHTEGHPTFYTAYLLFNEGYRPDVIPCDDLGNFFFLRMTGPLPDSLGGRPVYSTRAWNDPALVLSGLLFGPEARAVSWNDLEIFRYRGGSPDAMAGDLAAEAWALRMVQSRGREREEAFEAAIEHAETNVTRNRVETLFHRVP
ncbi:MAG: DUF2723 domain-containing protein [Candidatus Fermentibacteraceae bacterium]